VRVSGKAAKLRFIAIQFAVIAYLCGCSHGPVRHYTLGYYRYATTEFTKRSHWALKPLALPFGLVTDAVLIVTDTAATPVTPLFLPPIEIEYSDDPEINGADFGVWAPAAKKSMRSCSDLNPHFSRIRWKQVIA